MIGVTGGTMFAGSEITKLRAETVGKVEVYEDDDMCFLFRHGQEHNIPPHRIDHAENLRTLKWMNVDVVVGVGSVITLNPAVCKPGMLALPNDFFRLQGAPTMYNDDIRHARPGIDIPYLEVLKKVTDEVLFDSGVSVVENGCYVETRGPSFETSAELKFLQDYGDVAGMTLASEATIAAELNLPYVMLCNVVDKDNVASKFPYRKKNVPLIIEILRRFPSKKRVVDQKAEKA